MILIQKYFPDCTGKQAEQISMLWDIYHYWNQRINLISRKDLDHLYEHHVLHSMAVLKVVEFAPGSTVLDVGTGGGFPGIPLAIMNPDVEFLLIDGIGKKIRVVQEVICALQLKNVQARQVRVEHLQTAFDYIVSRAVSSLPQFYRNVSKNLKKEKAHRNSGIYYLKGGDLDEDANLINKPIRVYHIGDFFGEAFFNTKKIVFIPA